MDTRITTNDAAERLGITRQRVLQLINHGRLKAEKFANVYMIREEDLKAVSVRTIGRPPGKAATASTKRGKKGGKG